LNNLERISGKYGGGGVLSCMTTHLTVLQPAPQPSTYPEYPPNKPLRNLLTKGSTNTKLAKNESPTWALCMAQHKVSGFNVCPHATPGCIAACVGSCGLAAVFGSVMTARIRKTRAFFQRRSEFVARTITELNNARKWCIKHDRQGVVRLNTFSDIGWEHLIQLDEFADRLAFYDYTKSLRRATASATMCDLYSNYRLVYSVNEQDTDMRIVDDLVRAGGNAAVVLNVRYVNKDNKDPMPATYRGLPLVDGDADDDRSKDPRGCYVGLRLKGDRAKRAAALACGFARQPE
jgi:hypothetical protein